MPYDRISCTDGVCQFAPYEDEEMEAITEELDALEKEIMKGEGEG